MSLASMMATPERTPRRGRPRASEVPAERIRREMVVGRYLAGDLTAEQVCRVVGISDRTLRRWARELAASN